MDFFLQILANSLVLGTQILFLAISLYLIKAVSKIEHVALGAIGTTVAYGFYYGLNLNQSYTIAVIIALITATILGLISFHLLEKLYKNKDILLALLLSLAFALGLESLVAIVFSSQAKNIIEGVLPTISFGNIQFTLPGIYTILIGVVLAFFTYIIVNKTPYGRVLRSISENSSLVASLGVNQVKIRKYVYIGASIIAGIVGILVAMNASLTPTLGFNYIMIAFIALFVGGAKDIRGTILASYLIILIPEFLINYSPASLNFTNSYRMFFIFIIALLILSYKPNGIFSKYTRNT